MNKAPTLKEGNIILRQPIEDDILIREEYGISSEYAKMIGLNQNKVDNYSYYDAKKWYQRILKHPCKWVIEYNNKLIGVVSLRPTTEDQKAKFAIELYDKNIYGKGFGSKITEMVLKYAFEVKKYHKVFLRVLDYNTRAINCYKNCGFIEEGTDREGALIDGKFHSDIYMGILCSEYKQKNILNK